jgi:hypothetical protein
MRHPKVIPFAAGGPPTLMPAKPTPGGAPDRNLSPSPGERRQGAEPPRSRSAGWLALDLFRHAVTPGDQLPKILFHLQGRDFCFEPPGARRFGAIIAGWLLVCRFCVAVADLHRPKPSKLWSASAPTSWSPFLLGRPAGSVTGAPRRPLPRSMTISPAISATLRSATLPGSAERGPRAPIDRIAREGVENLSNRWSKHPETRSCCPPAPPPSIVNRGGRPGQRGPIGNSR